MLPLVICKSFLSRLAVALKKQFPSFSFASNCRLNPKRFLIKLSLCCVVKSNSMVFTLDSCSQRSSSAKFILQIRSIRLTVLLLQCAVQLFKIDSSFSSSTEFALANTVCVLGWSSISAAVPRSGHGGVDSDLKPSYEIEL